jgi:hypothetical protein
MADNRTASTFEPDPDRFAGMDPYLENPDHWQGFHNGLIAYLRESLNRVLPEGYIAFIEQRLVILPEDQLRRADLALIKHPVATGANADAGQHESERGRPDGIVSALSEEVYDWFIEIRTSRSRPRRVVAKIEVLSPTNKAPGSEGRREYQRKQTGILYSDTHLLEIDLLRLGAHTVAAPLENLPSRDTWDYIISLHRFTDRFRCAFWLNRLSEPLPEIQIPLLPGDADVLLDLQTAYRESYLTGRFYDDIDYSHPLTRVIQFSAPSKVRDVEDIVPASTS